MRRNRGTPGWGRRWFFVCPCTGENATKLHLPSGADTPSRLEKLIALAIDLSANRRGDRSLSRAFALRGKVGGEAGMGDYIPKPKGMHVRTFKRAMQRVYAAEETVEAYTDLLLARLRRLR